VTDAMYKHQIQSVIIEGGQQTLQTFIDANLWDEARIFKGNIHLIEGTKAPKLNGSYLEKYAIGQDELIISRNHD
jgi:diaminohydroxyphosphoribosylaminopyrimidine deaminase/5-amino-6-(5-phosphoribosylamino)uracil reductase